jgi:hypothetical protein
VFKNNLKINLEIVCNIKTSAIFVGQNQIKMKYNSKKFISIGGVPYSRKAKLSGLPVYIIAYDINTERHLIIKNVFDEQKRIELDNDRLILRERYKRNKL